MGYKTQITMNECFQLEGNKLPYKAKNAIELVAEMRGQCFIPSEDVQDFMNEFAKRCYKWDKSFVRTISEQAFIEDLITINYLKIIKNEY